MRSCLIATALAREQGLSEPEVADTFYTALLMHVGCSALSHETVAAWGDDRGVLGAVASTNVADPEEVAGTLMPTILARKAVGGARPHRALRGEPAGTAVRSRLRHRQLRGGQRNGEAGGSRSRRRACAEGGRGVVERRGPAGRIERRRDRPSGSTGAGLSGRRPLRRPRRHRGGGRSPPAAVGRDPRSLDRRGPRRERRRAARAIARGGPARARAGGGARAGHRDRRPHRRRHRLRRPRRPEDAVDARPLQRRREAGLLRGEAAPASTRRPSRTWRCRLSSRISAGWRLRTRSGRSPVRSPRPSGSRRGCTPTTPSASWPRRARSSRWHAPRACITSAWTDPDTTVAARRASSRRRSGSWRPPTPSTR